MSLGDMKTGMDALFQNAPKEKIGSRNYAARLSYYPIPSILIILWQLGKSRIIYTVIQPKRIIISLHLSIT